MGLHVLVPVDGSEESEQALEHVLERIDDPRVTLLHVLNPVGAYAYGDNESFDIESYQREEKRRREAAEEMLETYREQVETKGYDVDTVLTSGTPGKRILAVADEQDVDHIVMGSTGRSGVERVLFGSVAETVTRRASVPVTIVR